MSGGEPAQEGAPWAPRPEGTDPLAAAPPPAGPTAEERAAQRRLRNRRRIEWVVVVLGALVVSLLVRTLLFQLFVIPDGSTSMEPNLHPGDRVVVNKLADDAAGMNRGDVVVFGRPPNAPAAQDNLIKRVIGLPGEVVELRDGQVLVDGEPLDEPWLPDGTPTQPIDSARCGATGGVLSRWPVGEGEVLVMGDNRGNSLDGRCFGPIDDDLLVGRAVLRMWPLGDAGGVPVEASPGG